ncbi:hypothetical protein CFN78_10580 [Amycolatopsis antarctica]|uniref:Uncharacterized protein n=1 Tax=Amycolatopsis antarctica TaxID=1854586 RepID=A0A263D480_9PSEU|nr:hypothetical protein [Amycolatopsis antarctica]OZM73294.1 hypothetical protein CFN78_10580 [Amycolatopsis antarctica]
MAARRGFDGAWNGPLIRVILSVLLLGAIGRALTASGIGASFGPAIAYSLVSLLLILLTAATTVYANGGCAPHVSEPDATILMPGSS